MHEHNEDAHHEHLGAVEQHHGPHHQHGVDPLSWRPLRLRTAADRAWAAHALVDVQNGGLHVVLGPRRVLGRLDHDLHVVHEGQQHLVHQGDLARLYTRAPA